MLHTKSQGHRPSGSGEEDFWRVFTIYGRGGHLGHVTKTIWTKFCSHHPKESPYEIWVQLAQLFQRRRCLKMLTDDRQTADAGVTGILLAHQWAFGSGELNTIGNKFNFWNVHGIMNTYLGSLARDRSIHNTSMRNADSRKSNEKSQ